MRMLLVGLEFRVGTTKPVALINTASSVLAIVTIAVGTPADMRALRTKVAYLSVPLPVPSTVLLTPKIRGERLPAQIIMSKSVKQTIN